MRIISGIRPTGIVHIGNYLGAIRNWLNLQNKKTNHCFYFIADYHSFTDPPISAEEKREMIDTMMIDFLALGLDPKRSVLFLQSQIQEVLELAWIIDCLTPMGELERMTQYKDKSQKQANNINAGLFTYPALMAADILTFKAEGVPVGDDQLQHLEFTREAARRFNRVYGKTFPEPKSLLTPVPRLMSLKNPLEKMSKSDPDSYIYVLDNPESITLKIKSATSASNEFFERIHFTQNDFVFEVKSNYNDHPEIEKMEAAIKNLLLMYQEFCPKEFKPLLKGDEIDIERLRYSEIKSKLAEAIIKYFEPARLRKQELLKNKKKVIKIFLDGSKTARLIAKKTLKEVKVKVGLY
ncbi:MAG TPA: tryptophan--tRNA ligase [Candidatus Paceibacterota bacterium]|nr:tryptophan--tRNA ligase [Candidatus Paceibacterota bacterium]